MPRFHIKRNRKVSHRLMFDQKSWNNRLPLHERMALFVTEQPAPSKCQAGEEEKKKESTIKQGKELSKDVCSEKNDSNAK